MTKAKPTLARTKKERDCYEWGRRIGKEEAVKDILTVLGVYEAIAEAVKQLQEDD